MDVSRTYTRRPLDINQILEGAAIIALGLTLLILLALAPGVGTTHNESPQEEGLNASAAEVAGEKIFEEINRVRRERGLEELEWSEEVADVARKKVEKMAAEGRPSHTDGKGRDVEELLTAREDLFFMTAGEALYYTEGNLRDLAAEAIGKWMESPAHKALLLDYDRRYDEAGVGVSCQGGACYASAILVGQSMRGSFELRAGHVAILKPYDEALPFDFTVAADVALEAGRGIDIYFVPHDDRDYMMGGGCYWKKWEDSRTISEHLSIGKDNGIATVNRGQRPVEVSYRIEFAEPNKGAGDRPPCTPLQLQ